jgi:ABC-type uncharacterized transport system permease subunit
MKRSPSFVDVMLGVVIAVLPVLWLTVASFSNAADVFTPENSAAHTLKLFVEDAVPTKATVMVFVAFAGALIK